MSSPTPTIIAGRYELQRRLATGGMAEVWLAIDRTLDRKVAVKWLKPSLASDPIVAERFRREAVAAASLNHPNIVAVHDVFEQDGRQAVVMQLVDGKSLRQVLDTQNRLSADLTCHIGTAVALALDNAHAAGFVHRDVKPGNIMITPDGRVLLTDFGIAKGLHGDGGDDLTSDNIMMGTAKYLSPEQVRGKKLDGRADFYSLGLVLYECLAGRVPFHGESDADTALARLQRDPTDLAQLRATLPVRLVGVIHHLLARRPEDRPATGADLIAELKAAQEDGPPDVDETNDQATPAAPFSAGKLVRAPSDVRGRVADRTRGMRTPPRGKETRRNDRRPAPDKRRAPRAGSGTGAGSHPRPRTVTDASVVSGPVGIPGEPPHITGRLPVQGPELPATPSTRVAVTRADAPPPIHRDDTPPAGPQQGAPARGMSQNWNPSLTVVAGLVIVAVVVLVILWLSLEYGGTDSTTSTSVAAGADPTETSNDASNDGEGAEARIAAGPDGATSGVASIASFDPDGDDGSENDQLADQARADGDPTSEWRSVCYSDRSMGGKAGVGLVVDPPAPTAEPVHVDVTNGPFAIDFYASSNDDAPTDVAGWGEPYDSAGGERSETIVAASTDPATRHVLILLTEIGPDVNRTGSGGSPCSTDNPFRGALAEISFGG